MSVPGPDAPVTVVSALAEPCPMCRVTAGRQCIYLSDGYAMVGRTYPRKKLVHRKGSRMRGRVHAARKDAVRRKRVLQYKRDHRRTGARADLQAAVAAMRAYDVAEYLRLRAWWTENGEIFVRADRVP